MNKISLLCQKIRIDVNNTNLYYDRFENNPDEWTNYCVAMGVLEDASLALEYYENSGLKGNDGLIYLKLYGVLQAVVLQQDAICNLYKIIIGRDLKPKWSKIRNLRNLTVGHPIKCVRNRNKSNEIIKRCYITRMSKDRRELYLSIWNKREGTDKQVKINLLILYRSYKKEAIKYLKEVTVKLKKMRFFRNLGSNPGTH